MPTAEAMDSFSEMYIELYSLDKFEKDINSKASSFYYFAYEHYKDYITKIEALAESIGTDMQPINEGENITTYLKHQTIRNVK